MKQSEAVIYARLFRLHQWANIIDARRRQLGRRWSGDGCADEAKRLPYRQGREVAEGHQAIERVEADRSTQVEESQRDA